jgi:hypothetical protein
MHVPTRRHKEGRAAMPRAVRLPLFMNAVLVLGVALPVGQGAALAAGLDAKDRAELKEATRLFQQRKYEEAEKLFVALRLNHPDMASLQRNLGLCYYYLRRPEAALFYLRDYLARKGKRISPEDREDVERWIEEMETLRVQSAAAPATAAATAPPRPALRPGEGAGPVPGSDPVPAPVPYLAVSPWAAAPAPRYSPYPAPAPYVPPRRPGYSATDGSPAWEHPSFAPPRPVAAELGAMPPGTAHRCETENARDRNASPAFRRGFLALPYAGWQFPMSAAYWISSGFRFGSLLGGHLSKNLSLSGEIAFATWTWDRPATWNDPGGGEGHRAAQVDLGISLLRHVGWSWGEIIFGPRFGGAMIFRHDAQEDNRIFVNGFQAGLKIGLLKALSDSQALGLVADFSYTINPVETEADCFFYESASSPGEPNCTKTRNTFLGSLAAAMLF